MSEFSNPDFILNQINSIYNNSNLENTNKLLLLGMELTSYFRYLVNDLNIHTNTGYSLSLFVINRYKLDNTYNSLLKELYFNISKIKRKGKGSLSDYKLEVFFHLILSIISQITNIDIDTYSFEVVNRYMLSKKSKLSVRHNLLKVKIINNKKINQIRQIFCFDDDIGEFNLILKDDWIGTSPILFESLRVNLLNVDLETKNEGISIICDKHSYLIVEPDYLVDVTDLSQHSEPDSYYHYFVKRYLAKHSISDSLLIGNIVNYIFDELLVNISSDFDDLFEKAIKNRLLSFFAVSNSIQFNFTNFKDNIYYYYTNLVKIISQFESGEYSTEPSFISPLYGIQGRLDLLIENDISTTVMELKTGKSPSSNNLVEVGNMKIVIGAWREHYFQIAGYNLLIKYAKDIDKINACIIYSNDKSNQIRNSVIDNLILLHFLLYRNYLVALEFKLSNGDFKIVDGINKLFLSKDFYKFSSFARRDIEIFVSNYYNSRDIIKKWFLVFSRFISNEIRLSKIGNGNEQMLGFSSFWIDNINTKIKNKTILTELIFDFASSNFELMHLVFNLQSIADKSVFRLGDQVLVYPQDSEFPTKNMILKGYIKEFSGNKIIISLRNKKINRNIFTINELWNIELDKSDSNSKYWFSSIFTILSCDLNKQNILLGLSIQEQNNGVEELEYSSIYNFNENQRLIFNAAINSSSYFLIQGPPGTGKTSIMLSSLTNYYYVYTDKTILLSAYTNRAVEEIYNSISHFIPNDQIVKIGTRSGHSSDMIVLSELSNQMSIQDLYNRIIGARVIISTISSLYTNGEIFNLKNFDIAIIDEASQILESQIVGIISKVNKFILIGDEKQLPAVTLQDDINCTIDDEELRDIALFNSNSSYFERMITLCRRNNWHHSFGILEEQGRMHIEIMEFPNIYYYNYKLQATLPRQFNKQSIFASSSNSLIEQFLSAHRISFIDCPIEYDNKYSRSEAMIAIKIIELIDNKIGIVNSSQIGVISPFKLQCNNILSELDPKYNGLITVDTVERYQGSQREIIIVSMAVNTESLLSRAISFSSLLQMDRKLNVALTRAKDHLIMLGNSEILSKSNDYRKFIDYCKSKNSYKRFEDFII